MYLNSNKKMNILNGSWQSMSKAISKYFRRFFMKKKMIIAIVVSAITMTHFVGNTYADSKQRFLLQLPIIQIK